MLLTGYYGKRNLGDDLMEKYLRDILKVPTINCTELNRVHDLHDIVLGGGDLLGEYFLIHVLTYVERMKAVFNKQPRVLVVACGMPYRISERYAMIFTEVMLRHKDEFQYFEHLTVTVVPDLAFFYKPSPTAIKVHNPVPGKHSIGVFLARPIVRDSVERYERIVISLAKYLDMLCEKDDKFIIYLLAFHRCKRSSWQNDLIMNREVYNQMTHKHRVYRHRDVIEVDEMEHIISSLSFGLCMRFHSHVLCIKHGVPFVSLHNTPKVRRLLDDVELSGCRADPTANDFQDQCTLIFGKRDSLKEKMSTYLEKNVQTVDMESSIRSIM